MYFFSIRFFSCTIVKSLSKLQRYLFKKLHWKELSSRLVGLRFCLFLSLSLLKIAGTRADSNKFINRK